MDEREDGRNPDRPDGEGHQPLGEVWRSHPDYHNHIASNHNNDDPVLVNHNNPIDHHHHTWLNHDIYCADDCVLNYVPFDTLYIHAALHSHGGQ